MQDNYSFQDFLVSLSCEVRNFVGKLHDELIKLGCKTEVKLAKSGYVVSYLLNNKTIANYVFRKKGLVARIYANHIDEYANVLETLPEGMVNAILKAPPCKRLLNPSNCNPKCAGGYVFALGGERQLKCRYNAFMFLLSEETMPFIKALILSEAGASK